MVNVGGSCSGGRGSGGINSSGDGADAAAAGHFHESKRRIQKEEQEKDNAEHAIHFYT